MEDFRIALLGLGNVGTAVAELLSTTQEACLARAGRRIVVDRIVVERAQELAKVCLLRDLRKDTRSLPLVAEGAVVEQPPLLLVVLIFKL